jgi:hypothetical protein
MTREIVLDLEALRASADHSPAIQRQLVLLFIGTAERSLVRMQGLAVHGDRREWQTATLALEAASTSIYAKELAALCSHAFNVTDENRARVDAYLRIKEAYEGLQMYLRAENVLMHWGQGG